MTFREKVELLVEKQAGRGAGEKLLLQRTKDAFAADPEFVPPYNTKVLIDAAFAAYEKRSQRKSA